MDPKIIEQILDLEYFGRREGMNSPYWDRARILRIKHNYWK